MLSNSDVERMVAAGLDSGVIITTIKSAETKFNISPDELIRMKQAGIPSDVIEAMVVKSSQRASPSEQMGGGTESVASTTAPVTSAVEKVNPEEILMLDGERKIRMRYTMSRIRAAARGLGFGGVGTYAALPGTQASLRTSNRRPSFVIAVPGNAAPESYLTLASFAVRPD